VTAATVLLIALGLLVVLTCVVDAVLTWQRWRDEQARRRSRRVDVGNLYAHRERPVADRIEDYAGRGR
jgi:hypothetical protein